MPDLDQSRLLSALTYAAIALFLAVGIVSARYRRGLRRAAIIAYLATLAVALAAAAAWVIGIGR